MAGRDAAIAAARDELGRAAWQMALIVPGTGATASDHG